VYVKVMNADVEKAMQDHHLLLKTLSRSSNVSLVDTLPADGCVGVTSSCGTALHIDIAVSTVYSALLMCDLPTIILVAVIDDFED